MRTYEHFQNITLDEYEKVLANRKFWDGAGADWEFSTIEQKIIQLAIFAMRGGKLNRVINRYAKDREYTYRVSIQHCVLSYIEKLLDTNEYYLRIILLDKREILKLLTELLKVKVVIDHRKSPTDGEYHKEWVITEDCHNDESILSAIEERHKRVYPNETIEQKRRRANNWICGCVW